MSSPTQLFASVTVLTPNEHELEQLTGISPVDEEALTRAAAVLHQRGVTDVLITLGARGVFASTGGFGGAPAGVCR